MIDIFSGHCLATPKFNQSIARKLPGVYRLGSGVWQPEAVAGQATPDDLRKAPFLTWKWDFLAGGRGGETGRGLGEDVPSYRIQTFDLILVWRDGIITGG